MALLGTSSQANPAVIQPLSSSDVALGEGGYACSILDIAPGNGTAPGVAGIIGPVSATLDETKGLMRVLNNPGSGVNVSLRGLRLHVYTIGTGGTRVHFSQSVDSGADRYSSGGSSLAVNSTQIGIANPAAVDVKFGALGLGVASSNRRWIGNTTYKATTIETAEDCYQFSWGVSDQWCDPASLSNVAAALSNVAFSFPPVTLLPGQAWYLHQWRASITIGITFGVEGYIIVK